MNTSSTPRDTSALVGPVWWDVGLAGFGEVASTFQWWARRAVPPRARKRLWDKIGRPFGRDDASRERRPSHPRQDSFAARIEDLERWLFATLPADSAALHYDVLDKRRQKELAVRLGLEVACTYVSGVSLDETIRHLRDGNLQAFVIKPVSSFQGIGFRSLVKSGPVYRDLRSGSRRRLTALRRDLDREFASLHFGDSWMLEELLWPVAGNRAVVDDLRFYCFGGHAELVHQRSWRETHRGYQSQFFTPDWQPVNVGFDDHDGPVLRAPDGCGRVLEVAERAASQLCYPFVRVDLYDTSRGVVFGEFEPRIGRRRLFNDEWDERLKDRWDEAARVIESGIRSGTLRPLMPERRDDASAVAAGDGVPSAHDATVGN